KTYAKSGELVVRRPEPAIIPEGEVAVYLIAGRADDATAGALQHYLDVLEQQQITVLFGTDGLHYQPQPGLDRIEQGADDVGAHGGTLYYCSDRDEIQRAINRSVWSRTVGTGTEFEAFLESLASNNRPVHNVIVFAPAESSPAGTSKEPARDLWLTRLTRSAGHYSVKLSVALVPPALEQPYLGVFTLPAQHRGAPVPGPKFSRPPLQALKEKVLARHAPSAHSAHGLREISAQIGRSGWDLFVVEAYE
ncbi:MAG: hypothetical protein KDD69_13995, partial [Bdellovibrionales bacterium]|nr:hypothetical protein [Bdellovibrionales bacterium]